MGINIATSDPLAQNNAAPVSFDISVMKFEKIQADRDSTMRKKDRFVTDFLLFSRTKKARNTELTKESKDIISIGFISKRDSIKLRISQRNKEEKEGMLNKPFLLKKATHQYPQEGGRSDVPQLQIRKLKGLADLLLHP